MLNNQDLRQISLANNITPPATTKITHSENSSMDMDGMKRETFTLPVEEARQTAKDWLQRFPTAAYWSRVEKWEELTDGRIRFTMVRLPTAD